MLKESLLACGLTPTESKIYLELLTMGPSTGYAISKKIGIYKSNCYLALDNLKQKGLVSATLTNSKTLYQATNPKYLSTILREKLHMVESVIPILLKKHDVSLKNGIGTIEVFEGKKALRDIFERYLNIGETIYDFGIPKGSIDLIGQEAQNNFHKRRVKAKQKMYHLYNSDAKNRVKKLKNLPFTYNRFLPEEFDCSVVTRICGNEISISFYYKEILTLVITNKEMAKTYRLFFKVLWEKGREAG